MKPKIVKKPTPPPLPASDSGSWLTAPNIDVADLRRFQTASHFIVTRPTPHGKGSRRQWIRQIYTDYPSAYADYRRDPVRVILYAYDDKLELDAPLPRNRLAEFLERWRAAHT